MGGVLRTKLAFWALLAAGCTVTNKEGEAQCLDDFLIGLGEDRESLEEQAEQRGIEASALIEEIASGATTFVDGLIDCQALDTLDSLASQTGGRLVQAGSADEVMDQVVDIAQNDVSDPGNLVVMIDTTGSMADDLDAVLARLQELVDELSGREVELAMKGFKDQNVDDPWFEGNPSGLVAPEDGEIASFLDGLTAAGGGDLAESLYDGVFRTLEETPWTAEGRTIIAITDAPPLEGELTEHDEDEVVARCTEDAVVVVPILVNVF